MSLTDLTGRYPERAPERDGWILARRGGRNPLDPFRPHGLLVEEERAEAGEIVSVATIFLTNRECPWRCLMCDLWKHTLVESVPAGAIPAQIDYALAELAKQRRAGFQPASAGESPVAGDNGKQPLSPNPRIQIPSREISLRQGPPSHRSSPPGSAPVELGAVPARRSADFSPPPAVSPGRQGSGLKSALLNSMAVPPGREGARTFPPPLHGLAVQLESLGTAPRQIKLYNSGSFFDPRAIPPPDYQAVAERVRAFDRVIVECHPALVGESALKFRDLLGATDSNRANPPPYGGRCGRKLEVAMGLETAHPEVLEKLNKRMTLDQFRRAAEFLCANGIALRVFVLVKPPFLGEAEALHWAERSVDFAFDCGATAVSLIPTRFGNGALEALAGHGEFSPPKLSTLEAALQYGIRLRRGRVFADLWDLEKFSVCSICFEQRRARLKEMNLAQAPEPPIVCDCCSRQTK